MSCNYLNAELFLLSLHLCLLPFCREAFSSPLPFVSSSLTWVPSSFHSLHGPRQPPSYVFLPCTYISLRFHGSRVEVPEASHPDKAGQRGEDHPLSPRGHLLGLNCALVSLPRHHGSSGVGILHNCLGQTSVSRNFQRALRYTVCVGGAQPHPCLWSPLSTIYPSSNTQLGTLQLWSLRAAQVAAAWPCTPLSSQNTDNWLCHSLPRPIWKRGPGPS